MRCLHCHIDVSGDVCPQCSVYLPSLYRDILPEGTYLRNGAYQIDAVLGRGGFGITYRARHLKLDDRVAIKELFPAQYAMRESASGQLRIPPEQQAAFAHELQRFRAEGRCLKDLRAPGVVDVRDMFDENATAYLVMEFVDGRTLRTELEAHPGQGLAQAQVRRIVEQLVAALETIHEKQVYHLDIKPENILCTASGQIVLIDFGAARRTVNPTTQRQFDLAYAAPELFTRQEVGPESDMFELGMLVHELLTGQRPRPALECLLHQQSQVLSPALQDPWRGLIERALPLQKELRPGSVRTWWETRWDHLPPLRPAPIPHLTFPSASPELAGSQSADGGLPFAAFQPIPLVARETPLPAASISDAWPSPPEDGRGQGAGPKMLGPIPIVVSSAPDFPALPGRPPGFRPTALLVALLLLAGLVLLLLLLTQIR
ncbi:MAG TPA: protein kinase [Ktedonobacteraceae bacterium]|jgi:serine/threonine protein kinase